MTQKNKTKKNNRFALMAVMVISSIFLLIAGVLATALLSYHVADPAWSHSGGSTIQNSLGVAGAWYSDVSFSLLGKMSYLLPIAFCVIAIHAWIEKDVDKELLSWRLVMLMTTILSGCVLWTRHDPEVINSVAQTGGGALGAWLTVGLEKSIKSVPVIMGFSLIVFLISLSLLLNFPWLKVMEWIGRSVGKFFILLLSAFGFAKADKDEASIGSGSEPIDEKLREKVEVVKQFASEPIAPTQESEKTNVPHRSFTIDRYQPEEPIAEQPQARQPTRQTIRQQNNNPIDLSYFGISNQGQTHQSSGNQASDDFVATSTDNTSFTGSEQPQMVWDSQVANTQSQSEIPLSIVGSASDTQTEELTQQKSEPSLFDLGELKKIAVKRTAIEKVKSKQNDRSQSAMDSIVTATENEPLIEVSQPVTPLSPDNTRFTRGFSDNKVEPTNVDRREVYLPPIDFDVLSDTPDVIEPTPELQQSLQQPVSNTEPMTSFAQETVPVQNSAELMAKPAVKATTNATIGSAYNSAEHSVPVPEQSYELPSISLLDTPPVHTNSYTEDMLADMALVLETTLKQFNVSATVMHVSPGPVITRFEIELAPGVQAKKITNLSQDLARALAVSRVRVEEVIPGSTYVGLEVPNKSRETVYFKDVVCSKIFQESQSPLTISLGSDTSGKPVVADLMKMPHALVAGTTGSGKSVCINVMLLSMLYKASPKDLRLILVDPKMLEMSMYEDIPHLLTPVITDMNEAENALAWAVGEMERRYQLMSALKVRKIEAFNEQVEAAIARGEPIKDPLWEPNESVGYTHHPTLERLPFIVIVIDELADMMMVVGKQVEQLVARLTQKARAAGIHVVLATQRPSTDVLTGLIKANVPTRIAFQVSSGTDSRVIIDGVGAEKLLGHGDMLYVPPGASHPQRLHGAFVGDAETDRITNYLRSTGEPDYIAGITTKQDPETLGAFGAAEAADSKEDADPLYEEAVQIVLETGKASISSVQRQLRIGYNRAARMIEDMQEQGIVSEPVNGIRKVLGASHLVD